MREINRIIVSAIILSQDHKLLMGRKDSAHGGVYPDCWHIPGGGVNEDEIFEDAIKREVLEETGIDISPYDFKKLSTVGSGVSEKTLKTGEKVICNMVFNYFEVFIYDRKADEIFMEPADDLVVLRWFSREELPGVRQIPGGKEFFKQSGYID